MADRPWSSVIVAASTATVSVMPGFAVGAMAAPISDDLDLPVAGLGLAMSAFYAVSALLSGFAARLAVRLSAPWALAGPAFVAAVCMGVIAAAPHWAVLAAALVAGGAGNSLVQPAAARLIAARAPAHRRALASGMIGAALGAGSLVPGLLVAFVAGPWGWRAAMLVAAVTALVPMALAPVTRDGSPGFGAMPAAGSRRLPRDVRTAMILWAAAATLSVVGNNAAATYFVLLAGEAGFTAPVAGGLLSMAAVLAVVVRLGAGVAADRAPRRTAAGVAVMMALGAGGLGLIAIGSPVAFVTGAVLVFTAGWGWTGLLLAAALRLVPGRAEAAGHTVQVGVYTGAAIAPYTFAALTGVLGSATGTLTVAAAGVAGAVLVLAGARSAGAGRTG